MGPAASSYQPQAGGRTLRAACRLPPTTLPRVPGPITQFITFIYSSDLERSHRFYAELLGLPMTLDQGACRIYSLTAASAVGVCSHREPEPSGVILTLVTDDVDGWHESLSDKGVVTDGPPRHNDDFGIYHFFATDPDGHKVEVQRFDRSFEPNLPEDEVGWFA